jgi:hypothetical protein
MQDAGLKTFVLEIDDCGNVVDNSTLYDPSAGTDYSNLRKDLDTLRQMHLADARDADKRLDSIEGNLKETSIPSLVLSVERLITEIDNKASVGTVSELTTRVMDLDTAISTKVSYEAVQNLIRDAIDAESVFDGGVIT